MAARFGQFIKGHTKTFHHIKSLVTGMGPLNGASQLGHNPTGALALIVLVLLIGLTGYWGIKEFYGDLMSEVYEFIADMTLGVVVVHVAAAVIMSFMH